MADVYFRTANSNANLPFGALTADGAPDGSQDHPYSAASAIRTQLRAGNTCWLHPACVWDLGTASAFDWSDVNLATAAIKRWDVAGYEGWFPTADSLIRPSSWSPVGGGSGRWTYTHTGTNFTPYNEITAIGGLTLGDTRGLEYRPALTRCRQVNPITSATTPGDFYAQASGSDTLFTVYTGSDSIDPTTMFDGFGFAVRNSSWSINASLAGAQDLTIEDMQFIGGGIRALPGDGVTSEDVTITRMRLIGSTYMGIHMKPGHTNGLVRRWLIDMPYFDAGSHLSSPQSGVNASMAASNGICAEAKVTDVEIRDPKILGFSHSQIQALTIPEDTDLVDGDFSWPRNITVRKTRDLAGYNELTCGRGYRRGLNFTGHGWVIDRQHVIGQATVSQFSGRGVLIMPKWSGGYHTEASSGNYGGGSAFSFQHQDGGCQVERILMLSPVFDEVPNFPVRTPQGESGTIPDGSLRIVGPVVSSLDTYTPRYVTGQNSNVTWDDIPPFAGGRNFTGGVTGKGVDIYVSDGIFMIPEGETVIAAVQSTNEDGTDPASWTKRYTADTENAYYTRNQAFHSRAAAGFDDDLNWVGAKKQALPRRVR